LETLLCLALLLGGGLRLMRCGLAVPLAFVCLIDTILLPISMKYHNKTYAISYEFCTVNLCKYCAWCIMRDMAVNKLIDTETTPRTKVLANGAVYDMDAGRIVSGAVLDSARARDMQRLAVAKKREVMARAANREVQDKSLLAEYGDYAHVAERAITLQRIATTPEAGKAAVMAHQALTQDTGQAEPRGNEQSEAVQAAQIVGDVVHDLAQLSAVWADVVARQNGFDNSNYQKQQGSVVDGTVTDDSTAAADSGG